MKNHYLIDYENVSDEGLSGFSRLPETDVVELFYTQNANKIPIEFFSEVQAMTRHAALRFVPVAAGNQALDMQLGTYLGYLLAKASPDDRFVIVSRDKGYAHVISFWLVRLPRVSVVLKKSIAEALPGETPRPDAAEPVPETSSVKPTAGEEKKKAAVRKTGREKAELNANVQKVLSEAGFESKVISHVASFVVRNSSVPQAKSVIHTEIVRMFGQEKGNDIYNLIRSLL